MTKQFIGHWGEIILRFKVGVVLHLFLSNYYYTQTIVPIIHHLRSLFYSRQWLALNNIKTYNKTRCREYKTNRFSSLKGRYYIVQFLSMLNDKCRKWGQWKNQMQCLTKKKKKLNRKVTHINFYQLDLCAQRVCKHNSKKKIHCGKNWKYNPITSRGKKKKNCYLGKEKTVSLRASNLVMGPSSSGRTHILKKIFEQQKLILKNLKIKGPKFV